MKANNCLIGILRRTVQQPGFPTKVLWSLKRRGVLGTLRLALLKPPRKCASWLWDARHGVDTSQIVDLDELNISSDNLAHGIRYQPTPVGIFKRMIRRLEIRYEEFNFIDFGSGKGRTLLLAARHPFRSVIGVEFSARLHAVAQSNIARFRGQVACHCIYSVCMDAAHYRLPPGKAVLYFNFPFEPPVMQQVLASLHDCLDRELLIVNYEPSPRITRLLDKDEAFRTILRGPDCIVYRSI